MTLQRYRLLAALADGGGVTAAARAAGISQPALSQQLRIIERHYGFPLLMRSGRRVVLTKRARAATEYARRIVRLAAEAEGAMREIRALEAGQIAVAAGHSVAASLVPRALAEFRTRHPGVALRLRVGSAREIERWVLDGTADVGVLGQVNDELAVALTPFGRDELVVVHAAAHPLAGVARLDGEALAAHPLIVREPASSTRQTLERALLAAGLRLSIQFELSATDAILSAVAAGLGASVVSSLVVAEPVRGLRFRVRRASGLDVSRHLAVATHPDAGPGPAAREFVALLERGVLPPAPSAA